VVESRVSFFGYIAFVLSTAAMGAWDFSTMNRVMQSESSASHLGVVSLRPWLDREKTLGALDIGGFVGSQDGIIGELRPGEVVSIDLKRDVRNWVFKGDVNVSAPIVLNREALYVAFADGLIVRLDRHTGEVKWRVTVPNMVTRAMTIGQGKLYFVTGMQELGALDIQTGKQEWIVDSSRPSGIQISTIAPPLIEGGQVIIGTNIGRIEGFDAKTGVRSFSNNLGAVEGRFGDIIASPIVVGQLLIAARYDGLVAAYDRRSLDKAPIWKVRLSSITDMKTFAGGIYLTSASGDLIALNLKDGSVVWKAKLEEALSVIEMRETSILVSGPSGIVAQVERSSGHVQWKELLDSKIVTPPIYYEDGIWFSTGLGNLYGYSIK
jgi:outer membrane protein assembly factor BamB